jgi:uncharacterized BrkB/YihY/UPF0761 family membrane protein
MVNFIKKNWNKLALIACTLIAPVISFAGENDTPSNPATQGKIVNPIPSITSIPGLIHTLLNGLLEIGIPVVALAIIYCGFLFVFARGNPEKLKKAKDALLWTLIGAAILLGSWAIATMIQSTVTGLAS